MSAVSLAIARPLGWLLLAFLSFFIGVQLSGLARRVAAILHIVIVYYFLACGPENLDLLPISGLFVPLIHGFTVHATGILLSSEASLQFSSAPFLQRIRPIILLLADLRGLQRGGAPASGPASASGPAPGKEDDAPASGPESAKEDDAPASGPESAKEDGAPASGEEDGALASGPASGKEDGAPASGKEDGETNRLRFAIIKSIRALAFWALNYVLTEYTFRRVHRSVYINLDDVALDKQSLLPNFERRELLIRSSLCFQWIWSTYCLLTAAHDLCAVLFVSVLGWNSASDWPPLYGPLSNAFSLRRFWGSFWHRLHVAPFDALRPSFLHRQQGDSAQIIASKNALRSLWVFWVSAACHARMNWALYSRNSIRTELRFWTINWAVCLLETVLSRYLKDTWVDVRFTRQHWILRRVVGYIFVLAFFFAIVPAWQYSLL